MILEGTSDNPCSYDADITRLLLIAIEIAASVRISPSIARGMTIAGGLADAKRGMLDRERLADLSHDAQDNHLPLNSPRASGQWECLPDRGQTRIIARLL
jgi:hypothetical protein